MFKVIVIGIGKVDEDELLPLVKTPSNLYLVKDFDELLTDKFVHDITGDCKLAKGKTRSIYSICCCF